MQESVSMHKSSIPFTHSRMNQARSKEEEKEIDGKNGSPTKQKPIWGTEKSPSAQLGLKKLGEEC